MICYWLVFVECLIIYFYKHSMPNPIAPLGFCRMPCRSLLRPSLDLEMEIVFTGLPSGK